MNMYTAALRHQIIMKLRFSCSVGCDEAAKAQRRMMFHDTCNSARVADTASATNTAPIQTRQIKPIPVHSSQEDPFSIDKPRIPDSNASNPDRYLHVEKHKQPPCPIIRTLPSPFSAMGAFSVAVTVTMRLIFRSHSSPLFHDDGGVLVFQLQDFFLLCLGSYKLA